MRRSCALEGSGNESAVLEALDGLAISNPSATVIRGIKTVVRRDWNRELSSLDRVAIITGGGSGHEPAHVGYVGKGMLTAAVCGEVFASPTVDQVFGAILEVAAPRGKSKGVLLVVKCYTGDRLNFGMAAERARACGIDVRMVVVQDDEAIHPRFTCGPDGKPCEAKEPVGKAGRRGLAATVLVHKIAGAVAEAGASLDEVERAARKAAADAGTIGIALSTCSLPGRAVDARLDDEEGRAPGLCPATGPFPVGASSGSGSGASAAGGQGSEAGGASGQDGGLLAEFGMGIHGEKGRNMARVRSTKHAAEMVSSSLAAAINLFGSGASSVVMMVNNLGGSSDLEISGVAYHATNWIREASGGRVSVRRVYCGRYMTSMDMKGFSITILPVDAEGGVLGLLDAATTAPGWAPAVALDAVASGSREAVGQQATGGSGEASGSGMKPEGVAAYPDEMDDTVGASAPSPVAGAGAQASQLARCILGACGSLVLEANKKEITRLDTLAGDGDCGDTMADAGRRVAAYVNAAVPGAASDCKGDDGSPASIGASVKPDAQGVKLVDFNDASAVLRAVGRVLGKGVGGTSGVVYAMLLGAAGRHLESSVRGGGGVTSGSGVTSVSGVTSGLACSPGDLVRAVGAAIHEVSDVGGAAKGDSTLLDAAWGALSGMEEALSKEEGSGEGAGALSWKRLLEAAAAGARAGAEGTATMQSAAGRASYVGEHSVGVMDAGAYALSLWVRGMLDSM